MPTPTKLATIMPMSESRMMLVMILVLRKRCRLISSNILVFLHFDLSHADSLTDLIRLIEQVRSTPRKKGGVYWTKVSIDTLVLAKSDLVTVDVTPESGFSRAPFTSLQPTT